MFRFFRVFVALALFTSTAHATWQAGLQSGYITDAQPIDTATTNPGNDGSRLNIHAAESTAAPPWADDRCWIYTGQIFLTNGATYHFAENIDDEVWLNIGGTVYINDTTWNNPAKSGNVTGNGWVSFELRIENGGGGAGPVNGNNWTSSKGFGYNVNGNDSTDGNDYSLMTDNGSMNLFRYDDGSANPTNSSRKLQIIASGYDKSDTLTNFPFLVVLGTNVSDFAYSQFAFADGRDLYFTDSASNSVLKYEVEKWDTNGLSYVWVQIPTLKANTNIFAFWGDTSITTSPSYTTNGTTWDTSYRSVWHMELAGSNMLDSAQHALGRLNGVTQTKNNYPPTNAVGMIGTAISFESSHQSPYTNWITVRSSSGSDTDVNLGVGGDHAYTMEQWIYVSDTNVDNAAGGNGGYWCYGSGGNNRQIELTLGKADTNTISISNGYWSINHWNDPVARRDTKAIYTNWQHVVLTYDPNDTGGRERFYVNGQLKETWDPGVDYDFHASAQLFFHASTFSWWAADGQYGPTNIMDEVRFSTIDRGSNYQWATWLNTASNASFATYGSATAIQSSGPSINNASGASSVSTNTATLNGNLTSTGTATTFVWVYWGTNDGGSVKGSWANSGYLGQKAVGALNTNISGLVGNKTYHYRFYASNSVSDAWATDSSFTTLTDPGLYPYRLQLSFAGYSQTSELTNFPALVVLNTTRTVTTSNSTTLPFSYGQFLSGQGDDLRFADQTGTSNLTYEIEKWDISGSSYVWVKIPTLTSNTAIWAYWGDASQSTQPAYATNGAVWDASYRAVWHMQLSGSNLLDSSSNRQSGVAMTKTSFPPTNAAGMAGDAVSFDTCHTGPNTNWIVIRGSDGGDNSVNLGVTGDHAYMSEQWVYCTDTNGDSAAGGNGPYWCFGGGGNNRQIGLSITASSITNGKWGVQHWNDPVYARETYLQDQNWQHVVFTYDPNDAGGRERFYVNGELKQIVDPGTDFDFHPSAPLFFHASPFSWWAADGQYGPSNIMDEVRFSNIDRGSNYQWAAWFNTASNASFINYGAPVASAPSVSNTAASSVLNTTATANGTLLSSGNATTLLWIYYGISDGAFDKSDWGSAMALGTASVGAVSANLSGLSPETGYSYRFYASNSAGEAWAPLASGFSTYGAPFMTNRAATSVEIDGATLSANILSTGGAPTAIWFYWGTNDGSTIKASWGNVMAFGLRPAGPINVDMGGAMMENTTYYYTFYASNFVGESWGGIPPTPSFTTLLSHSTDSDSDGMPDWWEIRYFGGATNGAQTNNIDGDPFSNYEEYLAGTSPTNANSYFRIVGITSNQVIWIGGTNGASTPYRIMTRSNLSAGVWAESGVQARTEGSNIWSETAPDRIRFYSISATN